MENKQVVLSVKSVSKIYRMGEVDVPALRNTNLDIYDGEFLIIVGPSGSGKSTLLNIIGGMDRPTNGKVFFKDILLSSLSDKALTHFRRNKVGFIFQFYNLIPTLTALENIQVAVEIAEDSLDPQEVLAAVGLNDRASHFPSQLSGGEQQRVSIARALSSKPEFILCDEPTGALDLNMSRNVLSHLTDLNRNLKKTIVLITHNSAIAGIGHRIAMMHDGTIHSVTVNEHPKKAEEIKW